MMKRLIFITGNLNKLLEARQILRGYTIENYNIRLPEIQGDMRDIIIHKARYAAKKLGKPIIVEDTSLCFNALKGLPGPYIRDFLEKLGNRRLAMLLNGFKDKRAKAVCLVGLCIPGKEPVIFEGINYGKITNPRGNSKFGWDPIFQPNRSKLTFAQMSKTQKNSISHRRKALNKLRDYLLKNPF